MKYFKGYGSFWNIGQTLRNKMKHLNWYKSFWNIGNMLKTKCEVQKSNLKNL